MGRLGTATAAGLGGRARVAIIGIVALATIGAGGTFADLAGALTRTTSLISKPTGVADPDTDDAGFQASSSDGTRVFFDTFQQLTADDTDANGDAYQRSGGTTTLISKPTGVADPESGSASTLAVSADGTRVFFSTDQQLTADDDDSSRSDIYERSGGTTKLVSKPTGIADPDTEDVEFEGASADGTRVFFETNQAMTADDDDTDRTDVYERSGGTTSLVSQPTGVGDPDSDQASFRGASTDGTRVFFTTGQKMTTDDSDTDDLDVYERSGTTTTLISTGPTDPNDADSFFQGASDDGTHVFFDTDQALTDDDDDTGQGDVYERSGGTTTLVTQPTGVADPDSGSASLQDVSADGSRALFETDQALTADDDDTNQTDVYERAGGTTTLISEPTGVPDPDSGEVVYRGASVDGTRVFLETDQELTADDGDPGEQDVYEHSGGTTTLISKPTGVADPGTARVEFADASADGSRVFLLTTQKMTANDGDTDRDDVYERVGGTTTLISKPAGVADPDSENVNFSGTSVDGARVFFHTVQKLTPDDGDSNREDVYQAAPVAAASPPPGGGPAPDKTAPDTRIDKGPKKKVKTKKRKAKLSFEFSSEAGASFECSLDDAAFESCSSPQKVKVKAKRKAKRHRFAVRATDAAGNVDQSPDEQTFKVKRKKG